jgi:DnaJ family protein C protein 19
MATALLIGAGVTVAALVARAGINAAKKSGLGAVGAVVNGSSQFVRGGFEPQMSGREAIQIFGLKDNASQDQIKKAHRAMMMANHPDRGGSPYLSSKINEAKELLEKKRN